MTTTPEQCTIDSTAVELSDDRLIELLGQDRFDQMMDDDGGDIPTLVYNIMGKNNFIKFDDRDDIRSLINQLTSLLEHGTDELTVRVPGDIVPCRETWD